MSKRTSGASENASALTREMRRAFVVAVTIVHPALCRDDGLRTAIMALPFIKANERPKPRFVVRRFVQMLVYEPAERALVEPWRFIEPTARDELGHATAQHSAQPDAHGPRHPLLPAV